MQGLSEDGGLEVVTQRARDKQAERGKAWRDYAKFKDYLQNSSSSGLNEMDVVSN